MQNEHHMTGRPTYDDRLPMDDRSGAPRGGKILIAVAALIVIIGASFTTTPYVKFPPSGFTLKWYGDLFARVRIVLPEPMTDEQRRLFEQLRDATTPAAAGTREEAS